MKKAIAGRVFAALVMVFLGAATAGASDPFELIRPRNVEINDYLLMMDIVMVAVVDETHFRPESGLLPLQPDEVVFGALPHHRLVLRGLPRLDGATRVLAWAVWGAQGDTCYGNAIAFKEDGELQDRVGSATFVLDGQPIGSPGSYVRLMHRLRERASEHSTSWLVSGRAIALMRIVQANRQARNAAVEWMRDIVGSHGARAPSHIRWTTYAGRFVPHVGDSILVAIPRAPSDTVELPPWPDRLQGGVTPFGVGIDQLGQIVRVEGESLSFKRVHGVVDSRPRAPR